DRRFHGQSEMPGCSGLDSPALLPITIRDSYRTDGATVFLTVREWGSDRPVPERWASVPVGRNLLPDGPCGQRLPENKIMPNTPERTMTSLSPVDAERLRQAFLRCRDMEGTLGAQLRAYAAAGHEIFPAYGAAVDRLVARINENGGGENAPRPGEPMPPFVLPDESGRLVALPSLLERGPLAVMFFPRPCSPYSALNFRASIRASSPI